MLFNRPFWFFFTSCTSFFLPSFEFCNLNIYPGYNGINAFIQDVTVIDQNVICNTQGCIDLTDGYDWELPRYVWVTTSGNAGTVSHKKAFKIDYKIQINDVNYYLVHACFVDNEWGNSSVKEFKYPTNDIYTGFQIVHPSTVH